MHACSQRLPAAHIKLYAAPLHLLEKEQRVAQLAPLHARKQACGSGRVTGGRCVAQGRWWAGQRRCGQGCQPRSAADTLTVPTLPCRRTRGEDLLVWPHAVERHLFQHIPHQVGPAAWQRAGHGGPCELGSPAGGGGSGAGGCKCSCPQPCSAPLPPGQPQHHPLVVPQRARPVDGRIQGRRAPSAEAPPAAIAAAAAAVVRDCLQLVPPNLLRMVLHTGCMSRLTAEGRTAWRLGLGRHGTRRCHCGSLRAAQKLGQPPVRSQHRVNQALGAPRAATESAVRHRQPGRSLLLLGSLGELELRRTVSIANYRVALPSAAPGHLHPNLSRHAAAVGQDALCRGSGVGGPHRHKACRRRCDGVW